MITRLARPADAGDLGRIHVAGWRRAYRDILPAPVLAGLSPAGRAERWRETVLGQRPPASAVLVAVDGASLVGFAHVAPSRDAGERTTAELTSLYVDPARWGDGAGSALLDHARELARQAGCGGLTAWVLSANDQARGFYARHGGRTDGPGRTAAVAGVDRQQVRYRLPA